jgi:hypothetical protein
MASTPKPEQDEQRAKYLAALDAKKKKSADGQQHLDSGSGGAKGHTNRSGGKREFRRKSGG